MTSESDQLQTDASSNAIPPPLHVQADALTEEELARIRIPTKRSLFQLPSSRSRSRNSDNSQNGRRTERMSTSGEDWEPRPSLDTETEDMPFIKVGGNIIYADELMENYDKDVYRWAVLYENQRGCVLHFMTRVSSTHRTLTYYVEQLFSLPRITHACPCYPSIRQPSPYPPHPR